MTRNKELENTLAKLVAFHTVTGNCEEMRKLIDWIRDEVAHLPVYVIEHECDGFISCVITTQKNKKNPKVWLAAHLDVVDAPDDLWKSRTENGRMVGRGSFDMKFAAACYIRFLKELGDDLRHYDIGVMFTSDEEKGGRAGTKMLLEKEGYRGDVVFLPDGGGVWQFSESAKGAWRFDLVATGVSAHASRPWLGENAIVALAACISEVDAMAQTFERADTEHWHLTCTVSTIKGGATKNSVPDYSEASFDVRFVEECERERFDVLLQDILQRHPCVHKSEERFGTSYSLSHDNEYKKVFANVARDMYDIECGWAHEYGTSDARYFFEHNIPVLLIWPKGGGHHSPSEWIDLEDLERYYQVMKTWLGLVARRNEEIL